jgi:sulfite oxidase
MTVPTTGSSATPRDCSHLACRREHFITPTDRFFTRSHAPVPRIDAGSWRLEVGGLVDRPRSFSLEELTRELPGELPWGPEPVSTGQWTGVALGDLLRAVGVSPRARHVELVGLDRVERGGRRFGFGGSIDLAKALSDEVLLAASLNGAPLPAAHGFPLWAVVPGWIGARSAVARAYHLAEPSENYFQTRAYRFQPTRQARPRDVSTGTALAGAAQRRHPAPGRRPDGGSRAGAGRGWVGAEGRPLAAIEVDGGRTWLAG